MDRHTQAPWFVSGVRFRMNGGEWHSVNHYNEELKQDENIACVGFDPRTGKGLSDARLISAAPELLQALHEGRRAIGDHYAPSDCYATGPLTGDPVRDLVQCPACRFIAMYDAAIAKATGGRP